MAVMTRDRDALIEALRNLATTVRDLTTDRDRTNRRLEAMEGRVLAAELRAERLEARCRDLSHRITQLRNLPPTRIDTPTAVRGIRSWDATRTRKHLGDLKASGWTQRQIAAATGLSTALISGLTTGKRPYVSPRAEALILTIQPKERP